MMHFVEQLVAVRPYRVTLRFNTGEVRAVDLEQFLRTRAHGSPSAYETLLDPATFCQVRLDQESRTICWDGLAREVTEAGIEGPGPLDLCPDVLYGLSTALEEDSAGPAGDQASAQAELSAPVLKDEPPRKPAD